MSLIFSSKLHFLTTYPPSDLESSSTSSLVAPTSNLELSTDPLVIDQLKQVSTTDLKKYGKNNKTVHGHLLNHMLDAMFDLFISQKFVKAIYSTSKS